MMDVEAESLPDGTTPLDFLKLVYCSQAVPLPVRMRAAVECLGYVHPKLSVTAQVNSEDFAAALERAVKRSAKVLAQPKAAQLVARRL